MSFTTFKNKSVSTKIPLIELNLGEEQGKWFNHRPGVWYWQFKTIRYGVTHGYLRGNFGYGSFLRGYVGDSGNTKHPASIGSCKVNGADYSSVSSRADCVDTNKSFHYDYNTARLYVHFDNFDEPWLHVVIIGVTLGLSTRAVNINNIYYEPRLETLPNISKKKDSLYFGLISFDGGIFSLNNADGYFDNINDHYLFGQPITIKYSGDTEAYADYRILFKGYIEKIEFDYSRCIIEAVDNRKQLSRKIPTRYFDDVTYPDINSRDIGKPIPVVWGPVDNVPIICVDEQRSSTETGNYSFKIADVADHTTGITAIVQIYVDGIATTWANESLANATFELTTGNYIARQKVTGDIQGFKVGSTMDDNSLDVIEDMLSTYQDVTYSSDNYNTTEWSTDKSNQYDIGVYINKETELIDIIEVIAESNFATFLIQDDGRYTWKKFNNQSTSIRTIGKEEFLDSPEVKYDGNEFLTSINIKYKKDWDENTFASYNNVISESTIFAKYLKYQVQEKFTVLTTNTDAYKLSTLYMDYMDSVPANITIETGIQNMDLEIGNTVNFEADRINKGWLGNTRVEIVGVDKDLINNTVKLTGRSF